MEIDLVIEAMKLVVPTILALASLAYAIKQRNVVKREVSRKRYLESALSNLNDVIKCLKTKQSLITPAENPDEWNESKYVVADILKASFDLKKAKTVLEVSYEVIEIGEKGKQYSEGTSKRIENFDEYTPQWFFDFVNEKDFFLNVDTETTGLGETIHDSIALYEFMHAVKILADTRKNLLSFEEVYETIAPDSVKKFNHFFAEITREIFITISKPKHLEIDLDKFSKTDEINKYLFEKILNYSHIAEKFSTICDLISELEKARKELFLKVS